MAIDRNPTRGARARRRARQSQGPAATGASTGTAPVHEQQTQPIPLVRAGEPQAAEPVALPRPSRFNLAALRPASPDRLPDAAPPGPVPTPPDGPASDGSASDDSVPDSAPDSAPDGAAPDDGPHTLGKMVLPELPAYFVTASALSDQESEAEQLHAQLDDIRRMLAAPVPAPQPYAPRRPGRTGRPALLVLVVVLLVTVAALAGVLLLQPWKDDPAGTGSTRAPSRTSTNGVGAPALAPAPTSLGLPPSGPGIDHPGDALGIQVLADRSIAVTERAVLDLPGQTEQTELTMTLAKGRPLTGEAAGLDPRVDGLEVTINGESAPVTRKDAEHWTSPVPTGGIRTVLLSYRLVDAVAVSQPSSQGRALGLIRPLLSDLTQSQHQDVAMQIPADGVRNVICTDVPSTESLCGDKGASSWAVSVPDDATSAVTLLQLDLLG